ncbi:MAG: Cell division protein FtsE [Microgenomates group bacterium GW2011_GWB1_44_8]|nr:MAG: Cell division protein FtsE [Microgenomates group bacterium GW2011_GWB1_44_8]
MLVSINEVTKTYGMVVALDRVSFTLDKGEFVFLTGPSGSGKTTVVKLLLREILPTSGTIKIADWNLNSLKSNEVPLLRRKIGVVFQDFKLLSDRTVFENVALGLAVHGKVDTEGLKRIREVIELVGLSSRSDLFPAQLAGGELQRVCLARAIVGKPDILIADEPTGNLDVTTSWQIVKLIRKIHKSGTTVLMVTHNVDIVNSFSERVILLKGGKLIRDQKHGKYEF